MKYIGMESGTALEKVKCVHSCCREESQAQALLCPEYRKARETEAVRRNVPGCQHCQLHDSTCVTIRGQHCRNKHTLHT